MSVESTGNNSNQPNPNADMWSSLEQYDATMEKISNRSAKDYSKEHEEDFVGEQNYNSKKKKARSFTEWDNYPIVKGERPKQFGEREKWRHQKEAEFGSMSAIDETGHRTDSYVNSLQGQQEITAEKAFNEIIKKVEQGVADGKYTREKANELLLKKQDAYIKEIDRIRQEFSEKQIEPEAIERATESLEEADATAEQEQDTTNKPEEDFYPPVLPELPDHQAQDSENQIAEIDSQAPSTTQTELETSQPDQELSPSAKKQRDAARTAMQEIYNFQTEQRQGLEEALQRGEISQEEYDAKNQALDYYIRDRVNKVRDDYDEIRGEVIFQAAARELSQMNDQARKQKRQGEGIESTEDEFIAGIESQPIPAIENKDKLGIEQQPILAIEDKQAAEDAKRRRLEQEEREQRGAEDKEKDEVKDKEKNNTEVKEKTEAENEEGLKRRLEEIEKQEQGIENEIKEIDKELADLKDKPLVAINADLSHDKKELARDLAEQDLDAENARETGVKGVIKRLWKGTLVKKYYVKKYEREYLEEGRLHETGDGKKKNLDQLVQERSASAIERFALAADDEYSRDQLVHKKAGENMTEADKETTAAVSKVIKEFVADWASNNTDKASLENNADLKLRLENEVARELAKLQGQEAKSNAGNYYEVARKVYDRVLVAKSASEKITHEMALDNVMEGFKVYNAEVRDGLRSQVHRDNIDKITNAVENSKIGKFIPAEILAGALGIATNFTSTGARAIAGATGGIAAAGAISGLKERNRITEDRTRLLRDYANSEKHTSKQISTEGLEGRAKRKAEKRNRKISEYESKIYGTVYELRPAKDLTESINQAMAMAPGKDRDESLLRAISEASTRISISEEEQKDLISFSSADKRGDERLKLDIALIKARKELTEDQRKKLEIQNRLTSKAIIDKIDEQDDTFRRERAVMATKKAAKTVALGVAVLVGSRLLMKGAGALRDSLSEKNPDNGPTVETRSVRVNGDDRYAIERYEKNGWTRTEIEAPSTEEAGTITREVSVDSSSVSRRFKIDDWADNNTPAPIFDGNEREIQLINGELTSTMRGVSTMGNQAFNYEELAAAGRIKGILTIGKSQFEVLPKLNDAGQYVFSENGICTLLGEDGTIATVQAVGKNGELLFKYFEVAVDNGVDADGIAHTIPLATVVGNDSFSGKILQQVPNIVKKPAVYLYSKVFAGLPDRAARSGGSFLDNGLAFAPETARTGLGGVTRPVETTPEARTETPTGTTAGQTPEPAPEEPEIRTTAPGNPEPTGQDQAPSAPEDTNPTNPETSDAAPTPTGDTSPTLTGDTAPAPSGDTAPTPLNINQAANAIGSDVIDSLEAFADNDGTLLQNAWGAYSPEDRNRIVDVERLKQSTNSSEGRAFRDWLGANGYPEFARQTISVAA